MIIVFDRGKLMPKKRKSNKALKDKIQNKLKQKFVKADHYKALKARVKVLEKELKVLRKLLEKGARKASPATKRVTTKKPVAKKSAARGATAKTTNNLQMIKGVGGVIEKKLHEYGIKSIDQIAAWSSVEVEDFSQRLNFKGRIERERWVEQAKALIAGG
jgi:predicted flap endonuclease-1-like 5' DNA nuclease